MYIIKIIIFFLPFFLNAQNTKITIFDISNKKALNGIQILSESGSVLGSSNLKGEFEINLTLLKQAGIESVMFYNSEYNSVTSKLSEIPNIIYLEHIKNIELEPVEIIQTKSNYFTIKGYVRSWELVDNKLVKYADGLIEYHIPYKDKNYDFNTGIKKFATQYRTFKIDSIKQKSRIINISKFDDFFSCTIPKRDQLLRDEKRYKTQVIKDSLYGVYEGDKNVGYAIKDSSNTKEINIDENFDGEEAIKLLFWKFSGSNKNIEKWTGNGSTRHLLYSFSNQKKLEETNIKGKFKTVEIVNEIFMEEGIIYNCDSHTKYKSTIDKDRSFYNTEFWKAQIINHPLPIKIVEQLININENKNIY